MIDFADVAERINRLDFDHPFVITESGEVTDAPDSVYAPEVHHDDESDVVIEGEGWSAVSHGWTGQDRYRGPVLHASETLGGGAARHLVEGHDPGTVFVLCVVEVIDDEESDEPAGWIVLAHK